MFIFNVKVNGSKIFKYFFVCVIIFLIVILSVVVFKIFKGAERSGNSESCVSKGIIKISPQNYTNVLKEVHENIDKYVGKEIKFTGYVYRVIDLDDNQFVLARDMIINSNSQTVVVGFLCESDKCKDFENNTWVEVSGKIVKGDYHGDMPIIKINEINKIEKPSKEEYVYPPDENFIPTAEIL